VVQTGQANRQAAVAQAEVIIDAGVQSFHALDGPAQFTCR
jgi:glutamyl-tRNA reductase